MHILSDVSITAFVQPTRHTKLFNSRMHPPSALPIDIRKAVLFSKSKKKKKNHESTTFRTEM